MYVKFALVCLLALVSVQGRPGRVISGHNAEEGQFPYQISLQYGYSLLHNHVCGGSILNSRWILTAGHCITEVPQLPLANYYVKAGITNLNDKGQTVKVKRHIVHPDYQGGVNPNDLALLELEEDLQLNDKVQPVNLPEANAIPSGNSILSGWGSTSTSVIPIMPTHLQWVDLPLITVDQCKEMLVSISGTSEPLADTNVCTGYMHRSDPGACSGDSGGPLVTETDTQTTQVGIVSWGMVPCGQPSAPSVFTRVSAFVDWINSHIRV